MFDVAKEQDLFTIEKDESTIYRVTFDTRCFVNGADNKWIINDNYLSVRLYVNNKQVKVVPLKDIFSFKIPQQFEYAFTTLNYPNDTGVYFIEQSLSKQSVSQLNVHTDLKKESEYYVPNQDTFFIQAYDENNINVSNKGKIT